ncbi:MAG: hypothetical protein ACSLFK_06875 [Gemmatimonadaceae bacterium]
MPETPLEGEAVDGGTTRRPPSLRASLIIAITGAVIAIGATLMVLQGDRGRGYEATLAAVGLAAFGVTAYGLMQSVLAVIDTAGERRRHDRDVTERRTGDRARPPKE